MTMYEPEFDPGMVDPGLLDPGLAVPPVGPPTGLPVGPPVEEVAQSPIDVLRDLLEGTMLYLEVEQDEEDKEKGARILALVQQLLALNQRQNDQMMGATPAAKGLRKATGGL
jgi:hypothetical protein